MLEQQPKTIENIAPTQSPKIDAKALAWRTDEIPEWRRNLSNNIVGSIGKTGRFLSKRFYWLLNGINGLLVGLALLTPFLAWLGFSWFYQKFFQLCHIICVQDHNHSFYLFGLQMPLCERCTAMYGSMFLSGLAYQIARVRPNWPVFSFKLKKLPFWGFVLLALPIAIDGFTQMFGWRQSTWELRLLTGALFGLGFVWYLYPELSGKLRTTNKLTKTEAREQA